MRLLCVICFFLSLSQVNSGVFSEGAMFFIGSLHRCILSVVRYLIYNGLFCVVTLARYLICCKKSHSFLFIFAQITLTKAHLLRFQNIRKFNLRKDQWENLPSWRNYCQDFSTPAAIFAAPAGQTPTPGCSQKVSTTSPATPPPADRPSSRNNQ